MLRTLTLLLLALWTALPLCRAMAQTDATQFSPQQANQVYDQLSLKLATQDLNVNELQNAITRLKALREDAETCVKKAENQLAKVTQQIKSAQTVSDTAQTVDVKFLQNKQTQLSQRLAECRLFFLKSQEAITAYQKTVDRMLSKQLYTKRPPILNDLFILPQNLQQLFQQFDQEILLQQSIQHLTLVQGFILTGLVLVTLVIGFYVRHLLNQAISQQKIRRKLPVAFVATLCQYIIPLMVLGVVTLHLTVLNWGDPYQLTTLISYVLTGYFLFLLLIRTLFNPPKPAEDLSGIRSHIRHALWHRLVILADIIVIAIIIYLIFLPQPVPTPIVRFSQTLWITLLSITLISIIWLFRRIPQLFHNNSLRWSLSILFSLLLFIILLIEWMGYHNLAIFIVTGIASTLIALFLAWLAHKIIRGAINSLNGKTYWWQQNIRYYLGIKPHKNIPELVWFHLIAYVLIWGSFIIFLLYTWGLSSTKVNQLIEFLVDGFQIGDMTLVPLRLLLAVFIFSLLGLTSRWLKSYITRHSQYYIERGAQVELASIASYIGFAIAFLIALIIAGVNFTGLAIIAGALSVGIGFGLQNIVNNFVSGLILLIEKPIRAGDRIIIGNTEGFVKRVRIRSTQVTTMDRSDVIIPNSELIAKQVVNFMFRDQNWRVTCEVGVVYGSDTELVKKLLLEVAYQHPEVIKEEPNAPLVLFKEFGDSSLNFELWSIIRDVNKKYPVQSDLNFAIDQVFRQHGIVIAFPQRDIHVKDWPERSPLKE